MLQCYGYMTLYMYRYELAYSQWYWQTTGNFPRIPVPWDCLAGLVLCCWPIHGLIAMYLHVSVFDKYYYILSRRNSTQSQDMLQTKFKNQQIEQGKNTFRFHFELFPILCSYQNILYYCSDSQMVKLKLCQLHALVGVPLRPIPFFTAS